MILRKKILMTRNLFNENIYSEIFMDGGLGYEIGTKKKKKNTIIVEKNERVG